MTHPWLELVERHLKVYDHQIEEVPGTGTVLRAFVMRQRDGAKITQAVEAIRREAREQEVYVLLQREQGEDLLTIAHRPPAVEQRLGLHVALLALTLVTTTMAGASLAHSFTSPDPSFQWSTYWNPGLLLQGFLLFSLPLLAILLAHEAGHYIAARRHGIRSSLPFFLPVPPFLLPIGTVGAFIRMQDPFPHRRALFDVGIAGPIAGLLIALPIVLLGAGLTDAYATPAPELGVPDVEITGFQALDAELGERRYEALAGTTQVDQSIRILGGEEGWRGDLIATGPNGTQRTSIRVDAGETYTLQALGVVSTVRLEWDDGLLSFGDNLFLILAQPFFSDADYLSHPTFIAGWVGLLVTGLNLIPLGQLDGGHIARALLGDRSRWLGPLVVLVLAYLSLQFPGWLILLAFVIFTGGQMAPTLDDQDPLQRKHILLGLVALAILVLTFIPIPVSP